MATTRAQFVNWLVANGLHSPADFARNESALPVAVRRRPHHRSIIETVGPTLVLRRKARVAMMNFLLSSPYAFLAIVLGVPSIILLILVAGVACTGMPSLELGAVPLECPHCGAKTPSSEAHCAVCGKSFREETPRRVPVIDSPRLPGRR